MVEGRGRVDGGGKSIGKKRNVDSIDHDDRPNDQTFLQESEQGKGCKVYS